MNKLFLVILCVLFSINYLYPRLNINKVIEKDNKFYLANTVVIKLKSSLPGKDLSTNSALYGVLQSYGTYSVQNFLTAGTKHESSLSDIKIVQYQNNEDPIIVAAKLKNQPGVEWAEPKYVYKVDYTPNDPSLSSQYNLSIINAYQAWDISKGDSSIIIAIIDTGVDWDHPDLAANMWINKGEIPGNGVDDDGNGFVDDIRGWDFGGLDGTADNNPVEDAAYHGTFVAGVASAVSDNGTGIASIGYNSTLMAVKVARNDERQPGGPPYIVYGYEGIVYAVENGAKIINCSWGGYSYSNLEQETINYAVENGVLVVAAAGNENISETHYPSGYKGVLSVASSDAGDKKSSFSDYGTTIDVTAPGSNISSTWYNNTYMSGFNGTSFSSPITAGLAALVAQKFPLYSPLQIAEQIRINCDDINSLNPAYSKLLGKGRINAFNTLNNNNSISVRATDIQVTDEAPGGNGDGILRGGETITISVRFMNYLNPTSNLIISLQSTDPGAVVQNSSYAAGAIATLDSFDNYSSKFSVTLSNSLPENIKLLFLLNFSDGTYSDYQPFEVNVNRSYATQSGNDISLTITSKGTLGFNDYPDNTEGVGLRYLDGDPLLFEGALIYGVSSSKMVNAARNKSDGSTQDNDFSIIKPIMLDIPGRTANQEAFTIFNDDQAGTAKLGLTISMHTFSFDDSANANYIILNYGFTNTTGAYISNFYAGLFTDWDILTGSGLDDITAYDGQGNLGYSYHSGGSPDTYVGAALISSNKYGYWGIYNDADPEGFGIYDGFTDAEKWQAISSGTGKNHAGPGDVSFVTSGGPFEIDPGETINIAFAIAAGTNLDDLRASITNARIKYPGLPTAVKNENEIPLTYNLLQNYPNPFNPTTNLEFRVADFGLVTLIIYDVLGNKIATLVNEEKQTGSYKVKFDASGLSSGIYFYELSTGLFKQTKKMLLLR